jgi:hypothetical protein
MLTFFENSNDEIFGMNIRRVFHMIPYLAILNIFVFNFKELGHLKGQKAHIEIIIFMY